jgi:tRNA modification GTPase
VRSLADQLQGRNEASTSSPRVVLLGEPNAGKSSLLNALAGSSAALVSPIAGTTRDYLVRSLEIHGQTIQLIDTAGIEAGIDDAVVASAQRLGQTQHQQADLQLLCIDVSQPLSLWSREQLARAGDQPRIVVATKCDLATAASDWLSTSATTGAGLDQLRAAIAAALQRRPGESRVIATTAIRATASLQAAAAALSSARDLAASGGSEEWIAAELRLALDELGQVTGAVYTDDILDRVFSRFCIGK